MTIMHPRPLIIATALWAACLAPAAAQRTTCTVDTSIARLQERPGLMQWLSRTFSSDACGSLRQVLGQWGKRQRAGGRELQGSQGLDKVAAQAELDRAMQDPEFRQQALPELQAEPSNAGRELLLAAWLHEFTYYKARDLVLDRLSSMPE